MKEFQNIYDSLSVSQDAWDTLPIPTKAEMIKVAVKNGIFNLKDIRQKYNEYAKGGDIKEEEYISTMEKVAEENYKDWGFDNPDEALVHALNDNTYNYKGYYNKYPRSKANASTHWTDEFKTVYHPTFSNQSIYSGKKSQYNPNGRTGGFWIGENLFIPAPWQIFNNNAEGGNLFDGTTKDSQQMQTGLKVTNGWKPYSLEDMLGFAAINEANKAAQETAIARIGNDYLTTSNDATIVANNRPQNRHLEKRAVRGAKANAAWEKDHPNLTAWGNILGAVPFAVAAAPMLEAAASSTAGQGITTGLNYIANAAKAAPYVTKVLPWAEAVLATGSATHGIQEMQEGVFTPMTALEVSPLVPPAVGIGNNLYLPHLREHIYASKAPIGYDGMLPAAKRIAEGVLSAKRADIENPFWFNNASAETLAKEFAFVPKNISEAEKTQYIKDFGQRALRARADIWRMYNRLPQKYNTFVESERYPGTYTAPEDIKALKWVPFPDKNVDPGDFVNSVGGNVGLPNIINLGKGLPDAGYTSKEFGVTTLSDLWDLHPFSRPNDRLISRIQRGYKKAFNTTEAPEFKWLKPLDERLVKFEVGKLINAKPIMVKNDVPWTMNRKLITDANGNLNFKTSYTQGFHSDNIIPQSVIDWKAGKPIIESSDIQLNPDSYNFLRAKLTTKSRRK